jgi:pimeloyl-ACP methyl ester carboxylesterase
VIEQMTYIASLPESASPAVQQQLAEARAQMERLLRHEIPAAQNAGGAPASYFYDLEQRDIAAFARRLQLPALVLQGGRDYQVTKQDYELWQEVLKDNPSARFKFYPDLNHLFVTGQGMATPTEYTTSRGHVDARVIADIAAFARFR